jgi:uncharacterized protein YpiB (UPF0302 family)
MTKTNLFSPRKPKNKKDRTYILIVCEGTITEPNYFKSITKNLPHHSATIEIKGTGRNTESIVSYAQKIAALPISNNSFYYDEVYIVFDKDSFLPKQFNDAIFSCKNIKLKGKEIKFEAIWSNESFELWYILHFEYMHSSIPRGQYLEKLKAKFNYQKNLEDVREILLRIGSEENAIQNAKRLRKIHYGTDYSDHNPCTMVDVLVERLLELREPS